MKKSAYFWIGSTLLLGFLYQISYRYVTLSFDKTLSLEVWIYGQSLWSAMILSAIAWGRLSSSPQKSSRLSAFTFRGLLAIGGQLSYLHSIRSLPLILTTLSSYIGVCSTAIGAMIFLEHRISGCTLSALGLGLLGMYWADPNGLPSGLYAVPILSALCFSGSSLLTKSLSYTHTPFEIVQDLFYKMTLALGLWLVWTDPPAVYLYGRADLIELTIALAILSLALQLAMTQSYQLADLSQLALMKPLKIPLAALIDHFIYGRNITKGEVWGSLCIILAILLSDQSLNIQRVLKRIKRSVTRTMVPS